MSLSAKLSVYSTVQKPTLIYLYLAGKIGIRGSDLLKHGNIGISRDVWTHFLSGWSHGALVTLRSDL